MISKLGRFYMNRGYADFYKGFYLRSSYEYAYALYLDYHKISWSYETKTYDIGYKIYKPDFFIYDKNGSLLKIVEIKSRNINAKVSARKALEKIETLFEIECELLSYEELLGIYKELPISLNSVLTHWIKSESTTINKSFSGKLNAHFNLKHTLDAKKKIGEHTRRLWNTDDDVKRKMLEGLRKSGLSQKGKIKTPRVTRQCLNCHSEFEVLVTSSQKFCGKVCAGKNAIEIATREYVNKRKFIHEEIKQFVINWSIIHSDVVSSTPFNKISTTINDMTTEIERLYGIKDLRVISKAVFGKDQGRKELLQFMKKVCNEKIC
jgi:hypothetical protein